MTIEFIDATLRIGIIFVVFLYADYRQMIEHHERRLAPARLVRRRGTN